MEIVPGHERIYYTYIRGNIISNINRDNSYFGITFSTDLLSQNIGNLFSFFDNFFKEKAEKELFTKTGQNLKYSKESFEEYSVLNSYENIILETIKKNREDFRFGKYDIGKSKKGTVNSNIPTFNTYDVDSKDFFSQLEASNKVLISPEHPTLRSTTDILQRKITAKENEIASKESEIHKLSDEIKRLQGELSTSKKTAADLKSDYERKIRELSKKKDLVNSLQNLYNESASQTGTLKKMLSDEKDGGGNPTKMPDGTTTPTNPPSEIKRRFLVIMISVIFGIIVGVFGHKHITNSSQKPGKESNATTEATVEIKSEAEKSESSNAQKDVIQENATNSESTTEKTAEKEGRTGDNHDSQQTNQK
ncbi:MAG: hypothetical protein SPL42_00745 [Bacteroidales bacterium]|nr:hypothetical protein [Bacteroidales bacterium]